MALGKLYLTEIQRLTLKYFFYDPMLDKLRALKDILVPLTSVFFGQTLKAAAIGQEIGFKDLLTGVQVLPPFRRFSKAGTEIPIKSTSLEVARWQEFQPDDSNVRIITSENPVIVTFENVATAFVYSQRFRGNYGKMGWKIESFEFGTANLLEIFNSEDEGVFADFDNPSNPVDSEDEVAYPGQVGYRLGQDLILTFFSADGNDVEVLGLDIIVPLVCPPEAPVSSMSAPEDFIPYFSTEWSPQVFENLYTHERYPRGVMCFAENANGTVINAINVHYKIVGDLIASPNNRQFSTSDNKLIYDGENDQVFDITATFDLMKLSGSGGVDTYKAYIYINGLPVGCGCIVSSSETNKPTVMMAEADDVLHTGDEIEVYIENQTGTANIIVQDMTVKAR